jgi:hypothetical protein
MFTYHEVCTTMDVVAGYEVCTTMNVVAGYEVCTRMNVLTGYKVMNEKLTDGALIHMVFHNGTYVIPGW